MPTGYTYCVEDGSVTDFAQFAMGCARAFGALILMRDEPSDAPIPEEFKPSDYHKVEHTKALAEVESIRTATEDQLRDRWNAEYQTHVTYRRESNQRDALHRKRYEAMLAQVDAWIPPTTDHVEMKSFMQQQLRDSIKFDCHGTVELPQQESFDDWKKRLLANAAENVSYHKEHYDQEVARTNERSQWVRDLRESLKPAAV